MAAIFFLIPNILDEALESTDTAVVLGRQGVSRSWSAAPGSCGSEEFLGGVDQGPGHAIIAVAADSSNRGNRILFMDVYDNAIIPRGTKLTGITKLDGYICDVNFQVYSANTDE